MTPIRVVNTRTGRTTPAKDGADAALMAKIELDRRSGMAAVLSGPVSQTPAEREADMAAESRRERADREDLQYSEAHA